LTTFTLDAWVNPSDVSQERAIIIKRLSGPNNDWCYGIRMEHGGQLEGRIGDSTNTFASVLSSSALPAHTFSHVALTYDGAALKVYINGQIAGTTAASITPAQSTDPLYISSWFTTNNGGAFVQHWLG